jgi:hypothetical protein
MAAFPLALTDQVALELPEGGEHCHHQLRHRLGFGENIRRFLMNSTVTPRPVSSLSTLFGRYSEVDTVSDGPLPQADSSLARQRPAPADGQSLPVQMSSSLVR